MENINIKEATTKNWTTKSDTSYPGHDFMVIGCLMRIAEATEKMASNFIALQNERDVYKDECKLLRMRIVALKGVITKLKKNEK